MNFKGIKDSISELPADAEAGDLWLVKQKLVNREREADVAYFYEEYVYMGNSWACIGKRDFD